ncbi:MAG TPA: sterol desaturase family protein [Puia sp.]
MKKHLEKIISYGLYPALLTIVMLAITLSVDVGLDYKLVSGIITVFLVLILVVTETIFPLSVEWRMTKRSFWRDLKYILIDAPVVALINMVFGWIAIYYSERHTGYFLHAPIIVSVVAYLVVFEFFQYWYHRLSHDAKGKIGRFLWKVHVAHHLPDKVYVFMHAVFNPINGSIATIIIQVPLILLGISPEATMAATMLIGLQGLVSHFNVDVKAGWLNYILIGTETHRYHHSANRNEAKNYGVVLAIWDIVFGTFYYRPGALPIKLGVDNPEDYPGSQNLIGILLLPFKR